MPAKAAVKRKNKAKAARPVKATEKKPKIDEGSAADEEQANKPAKTSAPHPVDEQQVLQGIQGQAVAKVVELEQQEENDPNEDNEQKHKQDQEDDKKKKKKQLQKKKKNQRKKVKKLREERSAAAPEIRRNTNYRAFLTVMAFACVLSIPIAMAKDFMGTLVQTVVDFAAYFVIFTTITFPVGPVIRNCLWILIIIRIAASMIFWFSGLSTSAVLGNAVKLFLEFMVCLYDVFQLNYARA
ncbi:unnamed protein product, partial [Mesorhabditis spiculigera]